MLRSPCKIENVGKARNGADRYWCRTHGANATAAGGVKLDHCERADKEIKLDECFEINCSNFLGGVGVWGAVPPVFNTASEPVPQGVHVHARKSLDNDKKCIDDTFPAVKLIYKHNLFDNKNLIISGETSVNYFISRLLKLKIKEIYCNHCGSLHLDAGFFATKAHKKHLCNSCGRHFADSEHAVSNPIVLLRSNLNDRDEQRAFEQANNILDIQQSNYPGGIQLWASNPAILWTVPRPEQTGIHVHLYEPDGVSRVVDDTFKSVIIDGIEIDEEMLRHFMAQNALEHLNDRVCSIECPQCDYEHFDTGQYAFEPHSQHKCKACGNSFASSRRKKMVSNPIRRKLARLYDNHSQMNGAT